MNKLKHYKLAIVIGFIAISFTACKKDDPIAEIPTEEGGTAELTFLEVEREAHDDHFHYNAIPGTVPLSITFDQNGKPPVGTHAHLTEGKTYKLTLKALDFAKTEIHQEFLTKQDVYQAFMVGAPAGVLSYVYADRDKEQKKINVGVTGYLTVDKASSGFTFRYVLRNLNPGVKANLTADNWNNEDFASRFSGVDRLDLQFNLHPVAEDDHDH